MVRRAVLLTTAAAASLALTGCGASVEDYCDTFYGEGSALRESFQEASDNAAASSDPFAGLGTALSAPQELATFFDKLADNSPDDIKPDVEVLRDEFQEINDNMAENAMNPFGGLLNAFLSSATTSGSYNRVNTYTLENCGPPPGS